MVNRRKNSVLSVPAGLLFGRLGSVLSPHREEPAQQEFEERMPVGAAD